MISNAEQYHTGFVASIALVAPPTPNAAAVCNVLMLHYVLSIHKTVLHVGLKMDSAHLYCHAAVPGYRQRLGLVGLLRSCITVLCEAARVVIVRFPLIW